MFYSLRTLLLINKSDYKSEISKIPPKTTVLNLDNNGFFSSDDLESWTNEELNDILSNLPPSVNKLTLRGNVSTGTGNFNPEKLAVFLKAIPQNIKCIDLGANNFSGYFVRDNENKIDLLVNIPAHVDQLL